MGTRSFVLLPAPSAGEAVACRRTPSERTSFTDVCGSDVGGLRRPIECPSSPYSAESTRNQRKHVDLSLLIPDICMLCMVMLHVHHLGGRLTRIQVEASKMDLPKALISSARASKRDSSSSRSSATRRPPSMWDKLGWSDVDSKRCLRCGSGDHRPKPPDLCTHSYTISYTISIRYPVAVAC